MKKIAVVSNTGWSLYNFRRNLISSLQDQGYNIIAVSPKDKYTDKLPVGHVSVDISRKGINPFSELRLVIRLSRIYRNQEIDGVLHFTTKPNIWGSLAAIMASRRLKKPICIINNIAGLGIVFGKKGFVRFILEYLYRFSQRKAHHIFFQNPDDLKLFSQARLVPADRISILPGSGVDLEKFLFTSLPEHKDPVFIMSARLLKEKGVMEYAQAARHIKSEQPGVQFQLLGDVDMGNKSSLTRKELDSWIEEGIINWIPWSDDVADLLKKADCVVLPSFYREGTPRSLLEGLAIGRPIITTDSPGCRETVEQGINGYLVKPRSASSLIKAMNQFIALDFQEKRRLSQESRRLAEEKYDEKIVIKRYISILDTILVGNK